jgi:hypothetical protein
MIVTKSEYARLRGVKSHTVSMWLRRARLTAPAVSGGMIDVDLADAQLARHLNPLRRRRPRVATEQQQKGLGGGDEPAAAARLIEARASAAEIAVERARRRLEHERGVYALAADVEQQRGRGISQLIEATENWLFYDVPALLGVDDAGRAVLREAWRKFRERESQAAAQCASLLPKYVTDPGEAADQAGAAVCEADGAQAKGRNAARIGAVQKGKRTKQ